MFSNEPVHLTSFETFVNKNQKLLIQAEQCHWARSHTVPHELNKNLLKFCFG